MARPFSSNPVRSRVSSSGRRSLWLGGTLVLVLATGGAVAVSTSDPLPRSGALEPTPPQQSNPDSTRVAVFGRATLEEQRAQSGRPYLPFLTTPTLRAGLYELGAGENDGQQPHDKDELYYVLAGSATLFADGERQAVAEGDVVFIAAHVEHRFEDISEDLSLLVFFSEAEPPTP